MKNKKKIFEFNLVLWSDCGNKLLINKLIKVRRVKIQSAREVMYKRFPKPYFFELN